VFPKDLGVVVSPGSGVYTDTDYVTIELPKGKKIERLEANGVDLRPALAAADPRGVSRQTTAFRSIVRFRLDAVLPNRADVVELRVHSSGDTSRMQIRKAGAECAFEGDPNGAKVLITGFQPFPADGWHENVSAVAVSALRPEVLRGARVMRLTLPVEYDRAASLVTEVITRCQPQHVISFGQGGNDIALEHTAYNLQDTGELSGGAPDNRGILRAAQPISRDAPATRDTLLPLDAIEAALVDLGETPQPSTDPGRYICNNVMFADIGAMTGRGRAGFIHLPYTTWFDDAVRARFGRVAEAAVQATVDAP
jgi:pyroglutamyl-peptidase